MRYTQVLELPNEDSPVQHGCGLGLIEWFRNIAADSILLLLTSLLWFAPPTWAQVSADVWTTESGLSQNVISGICQTPDGYLWLATFDGLARFDGVRFTTFNKTNTPKLTSNRFDSLACTANGDFWAGTEGSGVTRYHDGGFLTYTTKDGLLSNDVRKVTADRAGRVWALSGSSLICWDEGRARFTQHCPQSGEGVLSDVPWNGWIDLLNDSGSGFWGTSRDRVCFFSAGKLAEFHLPRGWQAHDITDAAADANGDLWLGSEDGRMAKLVHGRWVKADSALTEYRDSHGNRWELGMGSIASRRLRKYFRLSGNGQDHDIVFDTFFEDREGSLWLGTDGQGLYRLRRNAISMISEADGLPDRNTYPIFQDHAGNVWIGTWNKGLACWRNGKIKTYSTADGLVSDRISAISEDRDGIVWIASEPGVQRFQNGRFEAVRTTLPDGPDVIRAIHPDREGTLWFGTNNGLLKLKEGIWSRITAKDGLAGEDVRVIIDGRSGNLWIGGYEGLSSLGRGQVRHWTQADGLPSNTIRSLYEDADGTLWIGTYDGGLGRLRNGRFTRYTTREGLFNNGVFQILEDAHGYFWMSSNRGIYRVSKRELEELAQGKRAMVNSVAYTRSEGLLNAECNGGLWPAGIRARNGTLWFPTQDGVAVIDPEHVTVNPRAPPVVIEAVLVDGKARPLDRAVQILPGQENLEIQYTALSMINSEQIGFKYRLSELDRNWVGSVSRRAAYYSHLPSGNYDFHVIAANSDGVWNMEGSQVHISVLPPFYRAWWFVMTVALVGAAGSWLAWQYRMSQLRRAYAVQEAFSRQLIGSQESERRRIAGELHDSLGQQLLIIKNWALLALGSLAADAGAREPLEEISTTASQAIDEVRGIAHNLRPYALEKLDLTNAIQDLVNQIAATSPIRFSVDLTPIDRVFSKEVEVSLYRIIQEALNNTLRHSQASEACVRMARKGAQVELTIEDDGRGFTPSDDRTPESGRQGFGLRGIAERVRMLGGRYSIQSAPGQGCTIQILLPAETAVR